MNEVIWNPWHGCRRYSEGCQNCYVFRRDESIGKDSTIIYKTKDFDLPLRKTRNGEYRITPGSRVYVCMTSDFFLDTADAWRDEIWNIMRFRTDLLFTVITKRIERFMGCIPNDWGNGWEHFSLICTVENQRVCDIRVPILLEVPICHKSVACEPLLSKINLEPYLNSAIEGVFCGGESGPNARICDFDWVMDIRRQCLSCGVKFGFRQTGARFLKDGKLYHIERKLQHKQAKKADIDT